MSGVGIGSGRTSGNRYSIVAFEATTTCQELGKGIIELVEEFFRKGFQMVVVDKCNIWDNQLPDGTTIHNEDLHCGIYVQSEKVASQLINSEFGHLLNQHRLNILSVNQNVMWVARFAKAVLTDKQVELYKFDPIPEYTADESSCFKPSQ